MVKAAYVDKNGVKKGAWSVEEDNKLRAYILRYGHWNWRLLPRYAGLKRCGKSCRLRWMNYLKPGVKRGNYSKEEEDLIAELHGQLGSKWSAIAAKLPGRTDNGIKNYWHSHLKKRCKRSSKSYPKEEKSLEKTLLENAFSGADVASTAPILGSQKLEKSEVYISEEPSSSNSNWDLGSLAFNLGANDESATPSPDLFSGFQESFWTEPFMVDESDTYLDFFNFLPLDEDGLLSHYLSSFHYNAISPF